MARTSIAREKPRGTANLSCFLKQERLKTFKHKLSLLLFLLNMKPMRDTAKKDKDSRMGRG
jgi:hypothetical protein